MPHIQLEEHLPGITGLLEYRKDSAAPIRELTQVLLRGPSTLTEGERELIATIVSHRNECKFCTAAHTAAANILLDEEYTSAKIKEDIITAPVSDKMKALLTIAAQVQQSGKAVTTESVQKAKDVGATDIEIHDTVLIAALFCLYNRYVDGLSTVTPTDPEFYKGLGERLKNHGYNRLPQGYDHLKKETMSSDQNEKITAYHWMMFAICFLGTAFAGVISTLMSVYLPVAVKDLLGDKNQDELNNISAYINAIFIFGGACGGFISGIISDKAGRKTAVIFSIACYGVFTILTGFMPNWWAVVICRFFSGFGLGGILVTAPTLMIEEWPKKTRAIFIGILSIAIPVGIFSAGVINYFVSSWRQGFLIGIMPVSIALLSIWLLKESKKWKYDREEVVQHNKKDENIFAADHRNDLIKGSIIFGTMLIGLWAIFSWVPTWIQSLITTGDAQKERGLSMMMLGMGGLTGGFLSGWLTNAIGLRKSMLLCFSVCAAVSFVLFKTNTSFSTIIYIEIAVIALFFGASQGVLSVYIPGLFPVTIRGTATGFCFNTGRLFTATAVLFVGVLVAQLGGYSNSLFIFSLVFIVGLVVTFFAKDKVDNNDKDLVKSDS